MRLSIFEWLFLLALLVVPFVIFPSAFAEAKVKGVELSDFALVQLGVLEAYVSGNVLMVAAVVGGVGVLVFERGRPTVLSWLLFSLAFSLVASYYLF